jgi:hypothetical protein
MKKKPVLITLGILVVLSIVFFFVRGRFLSKPEKIDIISFLVTFNNQVQAGNRDSVRANFEINQKPAVLNRLISVLTNKTGLKGDEAPLFKLSLDVDNAKVRIINNELAEASIPVNFKSDTLGSKTSLLKFKIRKASAKSYKIVQVDANKMMADYLAFDNFIKSKTLTDKDIYSESTLKAFETAKTLKGKYDTVVWFAHLGDQTYYYVVNGKWDQGKDIRHYKDSVIEPYKMGLLGPDLKEIIPVQYDLIHNINGTFPSLIEVEKDGKKGFYDLNGKNVVPVKYDQIFPIEDETNLAVLRNGDDYFYLKNDMTVSDKVELKISDFFSKIKNISSRFNLYKNALATITEYNSREEHGAIYLPPSYLVDLKMISRAEDFKNPLRKSVYDDFVHLDYNIGFVSTVNDNNWMQASFYSVRDYFLGGRSEFYDKKHLVIVDKKHNKLYVQDFGTDYSREGEDGGPLKGVCDVDNIRAINDSTFEVKTGALFYATLYDSTKTIDGGPYYHYLVIKDNKLVNLPNERFFGFTKYVKMDDSYLNGCYKLSIGPDYNTSKEKIIDHITPEMLRYMKNEIYADYGYQFKDKRWQGIFQDMPAYSLDESGNPKPGHASVEDSLTAIDKYNINWITQKLKGANATTFAAK